MPQRARNLSVLVVLLLTAMFVPLSYVPSAEAAAHASAVSQFSVTGSLYTISALTGSDAWAVGYAGPATKQSTLIVHWNGRVWRRVQSPNPGSDCGLGSVTVISAGDAWAVGSCTSSSIILHWNGRAWTQVRNPYRAAILQGVAGTSPRNVWAVGFAAPSQSPMVTVVLHWNGKDWTRIASPHPQNLGLFSVAAASAASAWSVGVVAPLGGPADILHWNGHAWRQVPCPNPKSATGLNGLTGVAVVPATDRAWAVGASGLQGYTKTLIVHWNGRRWTLVRSPSPKAAQLARVAALSSNDAWAVGAAALTTSRSTTLILHWNGRSWTQVRSPNPAAANSLADVAATGVRNAWAVGSTGSKTLILHWNGRNWS